MLSITKVISGSVCEEAGIVPGDFIISFKGFKSVLPLDVAYFDKETNVQINMFSKDGYKYKVNILKDEDEPLGIEIADNVVRVCKNNCKFCFVNQLPPKMRNTLYLKDDDFTYSFLFGNYVTLTNLSKDDFKRINMFKLSPLYISVHAINDKVRNYLLNNNSIKNLFKLLKNFAKNSITMHTQVVLCEGINDGKILTDTINKLASLYPAVKSLAIVPVGLTKHRESLSELKPISKELAKSVINETQAFNIHFKETFGENFVFAADEFYVKCNEPLEKAEYYGDFVQFENGVGMLSKFENDFDKELLKIKKDNLAQSKMLTLATGVSAYDFFDKMVKKFKKVVPNITINLVKIKNTIFGETVTVAGLICGTDYLNTLSKIKDLGNKVLISATSVKQPENIFLDDLSVEDLSNKLKIKIEPVNNDAKSFINAILND